MLYSHDDREIQGRANGLLGAHGNQVIPLPHIAMSRNGLGLQQGQNDLKLSAKLVKRDNSHPMQ